MSATKSTEEWDGMLSSRLCAVCGKSLNADGDHPAELYAGTFNGLCYACTSSPRVEVRGWPDGAVEWSYPPACPSWRRNREEHIAYADCENCEGDGFKWEPDAYGFSQIRAYCRLCLDRWALRWQPCDACGKRPFAVGRVSMNLCLKCARGFDEYFATPEFILSAGLF